MLIFFLCFGFLLSVIGNTAFLYKYSSIKIGQAQLVNSKHIKQALLQLPDGSKLCVPKEYSGSFDYINQQQVKKNITIIGQDQLVVFSNKKCKNKFKWVNKYYKNKQLNIYENARPRKKAYLEQDSYVIYQK